MFAGPNGSGKSTLKTVIRSEILGVYLNPDDMEREMRTSKGLALACYNLDATTDEVRSFLRRSTLLSKVGLMEVVERVTVVDGHLVVGKDAAHSYVASAIADLFRQKLLEARETFTFETVMSHPSKVELLRQAQEAGYRTYLYFIATEDPLINVSRVRTRVRGGGHSVPEDRIVGRYHACLHLLPKAIRHSNRAYLFDNSGEGESYTWLAEIVDGRELRMQTEHPPAWFRRSVWDQIGAGFR